MSIFSQSSCSRRGALVRGARVVVLVPAMLSVGVATVAGFTATASASACPNEASPGFRTYLPDCRAYEMVTPPYKEGFSVRGVAVSEGGSQVLAESLGNFVTPGGATIEGTGLFGHSYLLARTEHGWEQTPLDAPSSRFPDFEVWTASADLSSSLWFASVPGQSSADVYLDSQAPGSSGSALTHVGPGAPPGVAELALDFLGASSDLSHAVFLVNSPLLGLEEDRLWPGDTTLPEQLPSLYEYAGTGDSEPELVGVSNQTSVSEAARIQSTPHINEAAKLISNCGTVLGSGPNPGGDAYNAISASGKTVFFTSAACGGEGPPVNELYARIDREKTVDISEPAPSVPGRLCTEACAGAESTPALRKPGVFAGASLDGSKVFFTTRQSLVDEDEAGEGSGNDLYEAEVQGDAVSRLTLISRGGSGDATPGSGAGVLGVVRVSEDGSHVYFVAEGVLTGANGEGESPSPGAKNLYMFVRECPGGEAVCADPTERTAFIATLSAEDRAVWSADDVRPAQATPDGRFLVFQSTADLTPDQGDREEAGQVFEYNAQAQALVRVSQGQDGYNENGNSNSYAATIPVQGYELDRPSTRFTHLAVSADGSRVYFLSRDALTPQAVNGVRNVYQYHDHQVDLISDGHDLQADAELVGTDEAGRNVFFTTADRLLAQDTDTQVDIYDARVEGGPPPPAETAPCSGIACRGSAGEPPVVLAPASTTVAGESALAPVAAGTVTKHKTVKKKTKRPKRVTGRRKRRKSSTGKRASKVGRSGR